MIVTTLDCAPTSGWGREIAATLRLGVPLASTQMAFMAINTTDVILLGWLGPEALAAAGLTWSIHFVYFIFAMGIVTAVSPLCAQARGRRRRMVREVRRYVRQGLWIAVVLGILGTVTLWQIEPVLVALGQDPGLAVLADEFMASFAYGVAPSLAFLVLRSFVAAFDRTRPVLLISIAGVVANAVLNYGLVFGRLGLPAWGLWGAGLGSSLVSLAMLIAIVVYVSADRKFRRFSVFGRWWRGDWPKLWELLVVGIPIGGILLLEIGLFSMAVQLMGWLGTAEIAAHQIAIQCAAIAFMLPMGIGQAATIRVGVAAGANDIAGARVAGLAALLAGAGFVTLAALLFWFAPLIIVDLFLEAGPQAARVRELAVAFLAIAALFQLADSSQAVASGALRGLKDTRVPMLIAAAGYWVIGFPICYLLGFVAGLGGEGVWIGLAAGLAATALPLIWRFERLTRAAPQMATVRAAG
jgi:multidrug resistance protein, MATE family